MKPSPFAYHRPDTLDAAFDLLGRYGAEARLLAGGQSLIPVLNMRLATPAALIDINRLPGLDAIETGPDGLRIGALARHVAVERSALVARHAPLIAQAMPHVAHLAVRTRGTVGGSLALADPAAELPACAVALDARIRLARPGAQREVPASDFFRGIYTTALEAGEILTGVVIPPSPPGWRAAFDELARRHGDYALVGLAARCRLDDGVIGEARLVYLGVGLTPVSARAAESALAGRKLDDRALAEAGEALDADLDPPSDVHASAALRRHLARVLLRRVLTRLTEAH
ncbi:MAG: xanthine dehydrogenase family protein subunit M [Candidatus Rokubacteria bacterium]|nr:xanthine dehydrogenase family protein subunit M [Candidatus Rokubacteria bacterium]